MNRCIHGGESTICKRCLKKKDTKVYGWHKLYYTHKELVIGSSSESKTDIKLI